jgi:hypothetical protein
MCHLGIFYIKIKKNQNQNSKYLGISSWNIGLVNMLDNFKHNTKS